MIKQTITYEDYNGNTRTEEAYFNINDVELAQLEASYPGGFQAALDRVVKTNSYAESFNLFEALVRKAYGIKTEDGRSIRKSEAMTNDFLQSEAYSELFCSVIESDETAEAFFKGIIGAKHAKKLSEANA